MRTASRKTELELAGDYGLVAGMDEVGRGSLAGPVAVGVAVVDMTVGDPPEGLTDSKALTPRRRDALFAPVRDWVLSEAVGWSSSEEIDRWGIIVALRSAGRRALAEIARSGVHPGVVLLDGSHDWLSAPANDLVASLDPTREDRGDDADLGIPVVTQVKADANCAVVSAASVLAKVERDAWMSEVEDPGYDWAHNKGYTSPSHVEGLARLGPCGLHRRSWHLPGVMGPCGSGHRTGLERA